MIRLPGTCVVCRRSVMWTGKRWRNVNGRLGAVHTCPPDRPTCGYWMPVVKERCARPPHSNGDHRSIYALENARRMSMGRRHVDNFVDNSRVGGV